MEEILTLLQITVLSKNTILDLFFPLLVFYMYFKNNFIECYIP